jgi:hypothetical protein
MTNMIIECRSFTATPLGEGKVRLEIAGAAAGKRDPNQTYSASEVVKRLSELMGKEVHRNCLVYWRDNLGLPYKKLGPRKFLYQESEIARWASGRTSLFNI